MASSVVYGVVQIPLDVNSKICPTNVTNPSVYHCGGGENDKDISCSGGQWCFAEYTYGAFDKNIGCSCIPAVSLPAVQGSKPNPYNWIAGLVTIPTGSSGSSVTLPTVNGNLPHNLQSNVSTLLNNSFTAYADQTATRLSSVSPPIVGSGYLIVAYDFSWFQSLQDVSNFVNNPIWLNGGHNPASFTYNGTLFQLYLVNQSC